MEAEVGNKDKEKPESRRQNLDPSSSQTNGTMVRQACGRGKKGLGAPDKRSFRERDAER